METGTEDRGPGNPAGEQESRMSEDGRGGASGISRTPHQEDRQAVHMSPDPNFEGIPQNTDPGIAAADPTGAADTPGSSADAGHSGGVAETGQTRSRPPV